ADDLQSLVDLESRRIGQAPDVFQHADRAAVEAVHRPAEVRILEAANVHRLGVGADHLRAAVPEHQVGIVNAVTDDGADLVQDVGGHLGRDVPPGIHRHDLADPPLGDGG